MDGSSTVQPVFALSSSWQLNALKYDRHHGVDLSSLGASSLCCHKATSFFDALQLIDIR